MEKPSVIFGTASEIVDATKIDLKNKNNRLIARRINNVFSKPTNKVNKKNISKVKSTNRNI